MSNEVYYVIADTRDSIEPPLYRDFYGYYCPCLHHAEQFCYKDAAQAKANTLMESSLYYKGNLYVMEYVMTEVE